MRDALPRPPPVPAALQTQLGATEGRRSKTVDTTNWLSKRTRRAGVLKGQVCDRHSPPINTIPLRFFTAHSLGKNGVMYDFRNIQSA